MALQDGISTEDSLVFAPFLHTVQMIDNVYCILSFYLHVFDTYLVLFVHIVCHILCMYVGDGDYSLNIQQNKILSISFTQSDPFSDASHFPILHRAFS